MAEMRAAYSARPLSYVHSAPRPRTNKRLLGSGNVGYRADELGLTYHTSSLDHQIALYPRSPSYRFLCHLLVP
jgi:hypothetical protein